LNPFGASIIGGNLTKSGDGIFIDITLIGEVEEGRAVRRSGATPGDVILVTGYPGQSAAGLQLLLQSLASEDHPLVKAYNNPSHRAREGRAVALTACATAMIDTSDGFLGDLGHICEESRVGAILKQDKFPVSDELREAATSEKGTYEFSHRRQRRLPTHHHLPAKGCRLFLAVAPRTRPVEMGPGRAGAGYSPVAHGRIERMLAAKAGIISMMRAVFLGSLNHV
jgi:hypothetical protein